MEILTVQENLSDHYSIILHAGETYVKNALINIREDSRVQIGTTLHEEAG